MSDYLVSDEVPRRYYAQIPHIVIDNKNLSHIALRLYLWYKRVCGESGSCYQNQKTVSEGCSMSHVSIIKAKKELEEQGLIRVVKTGGNGSFRLTVFIIDIWKQNLEKYDRQTSKGGLPDRYTSFTGPVKEVYPKKNPLKKNQKKKGGVRQADPSRNGNSLPEDLEVSGFDTKAARHLKGTLEKYKADIRRVQVDTLAGVISKLRTEGGVPPNRIKRYLEWYRGHYDVKYAVRMYKRDDLLKRWEQHEKSMIGIEEDAGRCIEREIPNPEHNHLVCDVRRAFFDKFSPQAPAFQPDIDEILVEMGKSAGAVRGDEI